MLALAPARPVRLIGTAMAQPSDLVGDAHRLSDDAACRALFGMPIATLLAVRGLPVSHVADWGVGVRDWACLPGGTPAVDVVDLAVAAITRLGGEQPDVLIFATSTPARITRSEAHATLGRLGWTSAGWDVRAGGAAGILAWAQGAALAATGADVIVVASECISPYLNPDGGLDGLLYGDGAVALRLRRGVARGGGLAGAWSGHANVGGVAFTVPEPLPPRPGAMFVATRPDRTYLEGLHEVWGVAMSVLARAGKLDALLPYGVSAAQIERVGALSKADRVVSAIGDRGCLGCAGPLASLHQWRKDGASGRRLGAVAVGGGVAWAALVWES